MKQRNQISLQVNVILEALSIDWRGKVDNDTYADIDVSVAPPRPERVESLIFSLQCHLRTDTPILDPDKPY